jgi:chromosome segregation ATPase
LGVFGRRSTSLRGLSTAATKRRMTSSAKANIEETEATIARLQADVEELKNKLEEEANALTQQWAAAAEDIQETRIAPRKTDINVQMVALAWRPSWEVTYEDSRGRSRTDVVAEQGA